MQFIQDILVFTIPFLLVLGVVVTVHELGHFLAAKAFGTKIDRFSIGFGAAIASWQTFAPSFMFIFAGAPYAEALRRNAALSGALHAITAGVLGVIANLALGFGQHILFTRGAAWTTPWGSGFYWPDIASLQWLPVSLALAAGFALIRFKANVLVVILVCAAVGLIPLLIAAA